MLSQAHAAAIQRGTRISLQRWLRIYGIPCLRPAHMTRSAANRAEHREESDGMTPDRSGSRPWLESPAACSRGGGVAVRGARQRRGAGSPSSAPSGAQARPRQSATAPTCRPSEKELIFSNWPLYIDPRQGSRPPTLAEFQQADRHQGHLQRRRQRQRRVLRQGHEPARRLPADRPRHLRADRLDGGPDDRARLDPEARPREHARTSRPT